MKRPSLSKGSMGHTGSGGDDVDYSPTSSSFEGTYSIYEIPLNLRFIQVDRRSDGSISKRHVAPLQSKASSDDTKNKDNSFVYSILEDYPDAMAHFRDNCSTEEKKNLIHLTQADLLRGAELFLHTIRTNSTAHKFNWEDVIPKAVKKVTHDQQHKNKKNDHFPFDPAQINKYKFRFYGAGTLPRTVPGTSPGTVPNTSNYPTSSKKKKYKKGKRQRNTYGFSASASLPGNDSLVNEETICNIQYDFMASICVQDKATIIPSPAARSVNSNKHEQEKKKNKKGENYSSSNTGGSGNSGKKKGGRSHEQAAAPDQEKAKGSTKKKDDSAKDDDDPSFGLESAKLYLPWSPCLLDFAVVTALEEKLRMHYALYDFHTRVFIVAFYTIYRVAPSLIIAVPLLALFLYLGFSQSIFTSKIRRFCIRYLDSFLFYGGELPLPRYMMKVVVDSGKGEAARKEEEEKSHGKKNEKEEDTKKKNGYGEKKNKEKDGGGKEKAGKKVEDENETKQEGDGEKKKYIEERIEVGTDITLSESSHVQWISSMYITAGLLFSLVESLSGWIFVIAITCLPHSLYLLERWKRHSWDADDLIGIRMFRTLGKWLTQVVLFYYCMSSYTTLILFLVLYFPFQAGAAIVLAFVGLQYLLIAIYFTVLPTKWRFWFERWSDKLHAQIVLTALWSITSFLAMWFTYNWTVPFGGIAWSIIASLAFFTCTNLVTFVCNYLLCKTIVGLWIAGLVLWRLWRIYVQKDPFVGPLFEFSEPLTFNAQSMLQWRTVGWKGWNNQANRTSQPQHDNMNWENPFGEGNPFGKDPPRY
eukprot:g3365.t1